MGPPCLLPWRMALRCGQNWSADVITTARWNPEVMRKAGSVPDSGANSIREFEWVPASETP